MVEHEKAACKENAKLKMKLLKTRATMPLVTVYTYEDLSRNKKKLTCKGQTVRKWKSYLKCQLVCENRRISSLYQPAIPLQQDHYIATFALPNLTALLVSLPWVA
jgi:hypothetical protein